MNFLKFFNMKDINTGVAECAQSSGVILDVREISEYNSGHIENSINLPLSQIEKGYVDKALLEKALFVHCQSGIRSARATSILAKMGAVSVKDIGGISRYKGELV